MEPCGDRRRLSGMTLIRLTTITSLAAIASMCAASAVGAVASQPDEPTAGAPVGELVASLTVQGLFPVTPPFVPNGPTVAVYDDGTVLALDPAIRLLLDAPPYLLVGYARAQIDAAAVDLVVDRAEALGLTDAAPQYAPNLAIVDAPRTWVVVGAGEARQVHVVDGLVDDEEDTQRAAVAEFAALLRSIADEAVADGTATYEPPSAVAIQAAPADPVDQASSATGVVRVGPPYPAPETVAWPDPTVRLADATDCVVVDDPATVTLLADAVVGATFVDDGVTYAVAAQPVLPGHGCRPGTPPSTTPR